MKRARPGAWISLGLISAAELPDDIWVLCPNARDCESTPRTAGSLTVCDLDDSPVFNVSVVAIRLVG